MFNFKLQSYNAPLEENQYRPKSALTPRGAPSPRYKAAELTSPRDRETEEKILAQSKEVMMKHAAEIDQNANDRELNALVAKLNDKGPQRLTQLAKRLGELKNMVLGLPQEDDKDGKTVVSIPVSILEMMRLAGSTAIARNGEHVQDIRTDAHIREAPVDAKDIAARFRRQFEVFKEVSRNEIPLPDTSNWTLQECERWAKDIEKTAQFNKKMLRLIRSSSQSLLTGSLTKKDVLIHAPITSYLNVASNKLSITVPPCGQMIFRHFFKDRTSEIKLIVPYEFKTEEKKLYATVLAEYTILFDRKIVPISLTSKATPPIPPAPALVATPAPAPAATASPPAAASAPKTKS